MKKIFLLILCAGFLAFGPGCGDDGDGGDTPDAAVTADAGDLLPLFEECTDNAQCESDLCFTYGMGQMLCTQECANDNECPDPTAGCNNMGVCRRPGG